MPIASVSASLGKVKVRAHRRVSWKDVEAKSKLYEGDRLATEKNSGATVLFSQGRAVKVGPNSLILISAIREGSDFNFIVDVQKGSVVGVMTAPRKRSTTATAVLPIQLTAGKQSATVDLGKQVQISVGNGVPAKVTELTLTAKQSAEPIAKLIQKIEPVFVDVPKIDLSAVANAASAITAISPKEIPVVTQDNALAKPSELNAATESRFQMKSAKDGAVSIPFAKDYLPFVTNPTDGALLWSFKSLQEMSETRLAFSLTPPRRAPKGAVWQPIVEIGAPGSGEHSEGMVLSGAGFKMQKIETTLGLVAKRGVISNLNGVPQITISYREGSLIKRTIPAPEGETQGKTETERSFAKSGRKLNILALGDVAAGQIAVTVDSLVKDTSEIPVDFVESKKPISVSAPYLSIRLESAADFKDLFGFIRGAGAVDFSRAPIADGSGVFIVRGQKIVAQLTGTLVPSKKDLADLLATLRGDFVFKGDKKSFVDAASRDGKTLKEIAGTMIKKGQVFYVMSANDLVAVNQEFVSKNGDVARFIENNASIIFTGQVEVLESR